MRKLYYVRKALGCCAALLALRAAAQPPAAGPPPDSVVRAYLSRALTMQNFRDLPAAERTRFAGWAAGAGTRFAGRVGGFWYTPDNAAQLHVYTDTLRRLVAALHRAAPGLVVQGAVFEIVYAHVSNLPVPNALRAEMGEDTVAVPHRNFQFARMMYPEYFEAASHEYRADERPPGQAPGTPDMSQPETQLWFYYCARLQLDAGCEAIHFGQVMRMDRHDPGHRAWWQLLQRVRAYARTRNRGFVLCDAHTHGEYFDPDPAHPLPPAQRQLLFDFHSFPTRPLELDTARHDRQAAYLDYADAGDRTGAIYGRSQGGLAPNGVSCAHLPALVELDNGTLAIPGKPGMRAWGVVWGLDEISWFATRPSTYRDEWLIYAAARVRQLDPSAYLELPGLRVVTAPPAPSRVYRANTDGQGAIIPAIWAGLTAPLAQRLLLIGPPAP